MATASPGQGRPTAADIQDVPFDEPTTPLPAPLIGLWAVSPDACQSPEGEGWVRITANSLTAYEVVLRPIGVRPVGPGAWTVEFEESYLGTQFAKVTQAISLDGDTLTVHPMGEQLERYLKCGE